MSSKTNERTEKRESWHGFLMVFHNFFEQKRKYVIFLDIGEIPEKGVHESSVWKWERGKDFEKWVT
jgi:hypothetical protein